MGNTMNGCKNAMGMGAPEIPSDMLPKQEAPAAEEASVLPSPTTATPGMVSEAPPKEDIPYKVRKTMVYHSAADYSTPLQAPTEPLGRNTDTQNRAGARRDDGEAGANNRGCLLHAISSPRPLTAKPAVLGRAPSSTATHLSPR